MHAALGEQLRLGIVDELFVSDRSPKELAAAFDVSSNLLAHHLDVLEDVGLIERFESAGDRRRRYVRLLRPAIAELGIWSQRRSPRQVVFVCTQNSARSQLAAALWTQRTGAAARSAGTEPATRVHPGAVEAAARAGLDLSHARPAPLGPVDDTELVVTVCDRAHETIDPAAGWWHWSIPDPVEVGTPAAFDTVVEQLGDRIAATSGEGPDT